MQTSELSFPVVFHTENCSVHSGKSHSFFSLLADTTMASSQGTKPSKMNKRDEHRMICSFSNTTSYSTFYALFSSIRITLWPMWLANSKRQPCFYPPQEDTQNWQKKVTNLMGNLCCAREHSVQFFLQIFFTQTAQFNLECMGPFRVWKLCHQFVHILFTQYHGMCNYSMNKHGF
jgi:hypothetical protein